MKYYTSFGCSVKKASPIQALMGYKPRLPYAWLNEPVSPVYNDDPVKIRLNNFKVIHQRLTKNLQEAQLEMVEKHNTAIQPISYQVNDEVYIKNEVRSGINYKLTKKFIGPCQVLEVLPTKVRVKTPTGKELWVSKEKVKRIDVQTVGPTSQDSASGDSSPPLVTTPSDQQEIPSTIRRRVRFNDNVLVRTVPCRYDLRSRQH